MKVLSGTWQVRRREERQQAGRGRIDPRSRYLVVRERKTGLRIEKLNCGAVVCQGLRKVACTLCNGGNRRELVVRRADAGAVVSDGEVVALSAEKMGNLKRSAYRFFVSAPLIEYGAASNTESARV
jgi:hypothetical protein